MGSNRSTSLASFPNTVASMGNKQSRRRTQNNTVTSKDNRQSRRPISNNAVAPKDTKQPRRPIQEIRFRVLIIGRANAGKTSILQRVCDTTESPVIYRGNKEVCGPTFLYASLISLPTRLNLTHQWTLVIIVHLFGCL